MTFKENLLKKIEIDRLVRDIGLTLGPADSERRLDKSLMRHLLGLSPMKMETVRDLEIYRTEEGTPDRGLILVLDNDLAFYRTSVEDVAMRKSPTVKEMVSIRNAIKILNDKDVVVSKKEVSLLRVQSLCLSGLDLRYTRADLAAIAAEGRNAFDVKDADGVVQCLSLFAELTGYAVPPPAFKIEHHHLIAKTVPSAVGELRCGPLVLYNIANNALRFIEKTISNRDKAGLTWMRDVAKGLEKADREGAGVIAFLEDLAVEKMPVF